MEKIYWQISVAAFMQPLQYDLRSLAAKDSSITNAATAQSNLDAATTMQSAETELQNTIELRTTASEIVAPKPDLDARAKKKDDFETLFKRIFRKKITSAKMEKIYWQISVAAFMQPLQYDLKSPAAKDNSITNAATARSNLDTAIYIAGTILQLQSTMEFHWQLIRQQHLQSHLHWGNDPRVANHNAIPSATRPPATLATPFTMRERSYSCKSQWNSVDHTCTKNSWHPIYNAEPIREWSEDDPNISENDPTTHETVSHPSHRKGRSSRFGDALCMEKHRVSCICYLSKTHFVRDFLQNSIGNSSTSTTCNAIYSEGTILKLQITMQFHQQLVHQQHLQPHLQCGNDPTVANHNGILSTTHARKTVDTPFTMRNRSENDPRMIRTYPSMIRPHTRPSRTRRTAEVDHRRSGTDFVWKNIGFRASAISQKRISCETSSKTPSATPPPAPLAMPFTVRERS